MTDDPTDAGEAGPGRSDLYARIQDLQDEVENGLTPAQVEDSVRRAVGELLPALVERSVRDAVAQTVAQTVAQAITTALTDALPAALASSLPALVGASVEQAVAPSVASAFAIAQPAPGDDTLAARLAALEDTLDGVGDRIESVARDGATSTTASIEELRGRIESIADVGDERFTDAQRAEIDTLRVDLANALEYVRENLVAQLGDRFDRSAAALQVVAADLAQLRADGPAPVLARLDALDASVGRADIAGDLAAAVERLSGVLHEVRSRVESTPDEAAFERLHGQLEDVRSALPQPEVQAAELERIRERIEVLAGALAGGAQPQVDLGPVYERLDVLAQSRPDIDLGPIHDKLDAIFISRPDVDLEPIHDKLDALASLRSEVDLQPVHEHLDAVAASVPDLSVVIERLDALASLRSEVDLQPLHEHLDAIQASVPDLSVVIERLDALPLGSDLGPVHEHLDALQASLPDLTSVHEHLDALQGSLPDLASVHEHLDVLQGSLPDVAAVHGRLDALGAPDLDEVHAKLDAIWTGLAAGEDLGPIRDRLDALAAPLAALGGLTEQVDGVRAALASVVPADLPEQIEARLGGALAALQLGVSELVGRTPDADAASLLAARIDDLAAAVAGLGGLPQQVEVRLGGALDAVQQGVSELVGRTPDTGATDLLVARLEDLATVETTREAADADARAVTDALLEGLNGRLEALEQAVTTAGYAEESFQDAVRTQLEGTLDSGDRVLREVDGVRADLAAVRDQVAVFGEPSAGIGAELDALRADLANALDAVPQLVRDALPEQAEPDGSVAEGLLEVRTDLATLAGETLQALQALQAVGTPPVVPDLSPQLAALSDQVDRIPNPTETLIALRDAVADLPDHGTALAGLRDRVDELAVSLESVSQVLPVLQESVTTGDTRVGELRDSLAKLPSQVEAWRADSDDDRRRLVEALNALDLARADMASLVEQIRDQGSVAADLVKDASLESLDRVRADTERAVADLRTEIEAARGALDEHVRSIRTQVGEFSRQGAAEALEEIRSALIAQAEETNAARAEMDRIAARVQSAGRLLVAYLGERDIALEEVRDRTTVALLEDVLSGLPRRDREKAAEHARGLLARRREGRQAERWRRHRSEGEATLPAADDAALLELLDAPDPGAHTSAAAGPAAPSPGSTTTPDLPAAATPSGPQASVPTPPKPSASASRRASTDRTTPRRGAAKAPAKAPTKTAARAAARATTAPTAPTPAPTPAPTRTSTPTPTSTPTTPPPARTPAAKKAPTSGRRRLRRSRAAPVRHRAPRPRSRRRAPRRRRAAAGPPGATSAPRSPSILAAARSGRTTP